MKRYQRITLESGKQVQHSTIRGLKLAIKNKKEAAGTYKCTCPSGNIHIWDILHTSTHEGVGHAPRKKSARIGKGAVYNYTAKWVKLITA